MNPLSESETAAIWQVLVDHAGAVPHSRELFLYQQTTMALPEYRLNSMLGAGGKFRRNRVWIGSCCHETWTVDCYREDMTPDRQAAIDSTNEALAELRKELVKQ